MLKSIKQIIAEYGGVDGFLSQSISRGPDVDAELLRAADRLAEVEASNKVKEI